MYLQDTTEKQFNGQQQAVIEAFGGHHLVLAPPGCGKTAVLAERIVWAHSHGVAFEDMACLTFTNRAARGMRERILARLGQAGNIDQLFVGNVHRFCSRFLFQNGIVPENTTIIDTDTSMSILSDFLGEDELRVLGEASQRQRYSQIINLQHLLYQCEHNYPSRLIVHRDALQPALLKELCLAFGLKYSQQSVIDLYRNAGHYRDEHALLSQEAKNLLQMFYAARQYALYKRRADLLDFEDLLLVTYDAMSSLRTLHKQPDDQTTKQPSTGQKPLRWIQVDEVQDLNPLQLAIINLFTADDATVVYLGDAQQAIFSFMGAQTDTLSLLRKHCGEDHFHNFHVNYRSPQYLLDVFNTYGENQLHIDKALLPSTTNRQPMQPGDLRLMDAETNIDEANIVAAEVKRIYECHPHDTVAVVVAFNSDAEEVSAALGALPHFKISGTDFFSTPPMRLLLAHLSVLAMEQNFIAWSHLFAGLHVYSTNSGARQFVRALMELAISPVDFIDYDSSTYLAEFVKTYEQQDIVVFDTETTGLDVFNDDVVQIAAVRVKQGRIVDELNIFVDTDREIPAMLGDVVNPLVEEYAHQPHLTHREALSRFADFARDCAILGHNATYDYQIMEHNMQRYAPGLSMHQLWPCYFDTLKLARLIHPRQPSYKLKDLLVQLHLEGANSHLANDDIVATLNLAVCCYDQARSLVGKQMEFISRHRRNIDHFRNAYSDLYRHSRQQLYVPDARPVLARELEYAYDYLRKARLVDTLPKLIYIIRYIETDLLGADSGSSLAQQLNSHIQDLCTMKEADLCGSVSMPERVFVSTVHKAKGLEFDHVVVYDAVDGKYPSVYANTRGSDMEEARKFYVAISRARKRLIISYCRLMITRWGKQYPKKLSPYVDSIRSFFM